MGNACLDVAMLIYVAQVHRRECDIRSSHHSFNNVNVGGIDKLIDFRIAVFTQNALHFLKKEQ